jgi:hypothetical protein
MRGRPGIGADFCLWAKFIPRALLNFVQSLPPFVSLGGL